PPSNWTPIGPFTHSNTGSWSSGQGRVNVVCIDPSNTNTLYIGSPAGGIWKSINAGLNWTPLSDELPQIGVSGIAVDPANSNIIYIATGDKDASDTYFVGVMKSIDGGVTWNATGAIPSGSGRTASDIFIDHANSNIIWVATNSGVYRSINAGTSWTSVLAGNIKEIEIKPGDSSIVYAVTDDVFYKSTDGGATFTAIANGLPATSGRYAIEITAANPNYVYILSATLADDTFQGIYKSTDSGANFTKTLQNTDIFESTQSWYDMAFGVSQTNADEMYTGCLNVWKSTNGGDSFTKMNSWSSPAAASYTHADIHFLRFYGNKLFCGSDGGVYASTNGGTNFTSLTAGLQIGQFYKIAVARQTTTKIMGGLQDNGGHAYSNGQWKNYYGADGMDVAIDPNNSNKYYGFIQNGGTLYITRNAGNSNTSSVGAPAGESGNWITPLAVNSIGEVFGGYTKLYKLNGAGTAWVAQSTTSLGASDPNTDNIELIAIDPSNDDNMYVANAKQLYKSIDRGITFNPVALLATNITSICVHSSNSSIVYVTTSGNSSGKALKSIDGGATFADITAGLPSIAKNVIKHQARHIDNPLYVGTSLGVYYKDDTMATWQPFDTNLPNVAVKDLEINVEDSKIIAGTFGRGVWESPIPEPELCASTTSWNGSAWNNGIPTKSSAAIFNADFISTGDLEACSATVNGTAQVQFLSGHDFTVGDIVTVASGAKITFENNANLVQINSVNNIGNIVVKRDSTPLKQGDYTAWSSPVQPQNLLAFSPSTNTSRFYQFLYTGSTSATAYQSVNPTTTNFAPAKGYIILAPSNLSSVTPYNGVFNGVPNNGPYSLNVGVGGAGGTTYGYNVVGNPYPSPISANDFIRTNASMGTLYFWTHTQPYAGSEAIYKNNFATYTLMGGVASVAGGQIPDGIIQSGQGFYLKHTAIALLPTPESAFFYNYMRTKNSNGQFFKTAENQTAETEKDLFRLNLTDATNSYNQILIGYSKEATNEYDIMFDGNVMDENNTIIYSKINNENAPFAIQGKAFPFADTDVVSLGFKANTAGSYSITIENVSGLFNDQIIFIKDNTTGTVHNLKQASYTFNSELGVFNDRFEIVYTNQTLGNEQFVNTNSLIVYAKNNQIVVKSEDEAIDSIAVYDVSGKILHNSHKLNKTYFAISNIPSNNQVLLVKTALKNGQTVTKKIIF
ncbi:T9SS sorting signal type C domain-containing protein, partial [Flavobacterium sp.]|uniref:VPS10 domain-containing protein n=1 Tax=Flavobacterium sp. TaxID=239 RepID=UPI00262FA1AC